jgi:hypothetical protein
VRPRQVWGLGAIVAALGLLGMVVVAADGRPLVAGRSSGKLDIGSSWQTPVAVVGALLLVAGLVVVALSIATQRPVRTVWRRRSTWWLWVVLLGLGLLALLVLRPNQTHHQPDQSGQSGAGDVQDDTQQRPARAPWALLVLGGVAVGALAAAMVAGRRIDREERTPPDVPDGLVDAFEESLVALDASADPRDGIIAAYTKLLTAFEEHGAGRQLPETPEEHLRRCLLALPVRTGPPQRLVDLFLEARFSTHALGEAERDAARGALAEVRHDLSIASPLTSAAVST